MIIIIIILSEQQTTEKFAMLRTNLKLLASPFFSCPTKDSQPSRRNHLEQYCGLSWACPANMFRSSQKIMKELFWAPPRPE